MAAKAIYVWTYKCPFVYLAKRKNNSHLKQGTAHIHQVPNSTFLLDERYSKIAEPEVDMNQSKLQQRQGWLTKLYLSAITISCAIL